VAGKVTVGLASHWPCVTDFTHGLDREMRTPPTLSCGVWPCVFNEVILCKEEVHITAVFTVLRKKIQPKFKIQKLGVQ